MQKEIGFIIPLELSKSEFMDKTNLEVTEQYLNLRIMSPTFLPIPLLMSCDSRFNGYVKSSKTIRIVWLGRIVDFKYFILKRALTDINALAEGTFDLNLEVTIVGKKVCFHNLILRNISFLIIVQKAIILIYLSIMLNSL